jgi:hypothetical protein
VPGLKISVNRPSLVANADPRPSPSEVSTSCPLGVLLRLSMSGGD